MMGHTRCGVKSYSPTLAKCEAVTEDVKQLFLGFGQRRTRHGQIGRAASAHTSGDFPAGKTTFAFTWLLYRVCVIAIAAVLQTPESTFAEGVDERRARLGN